MPELGHDVKDTQVYTWRLTNWKKLEKKITSPEFDCGGHKWWVASPSSVASSEIVRAPRRILLFPFGNSNAPPNDTVSVYLDYAEPKKSPEGWHACAQFALVISNIHDPTIYTVSRKRLFPSLELGQQPSPSTQMPTTASLLKSVTGGSLALANYANSSPYRRVILDQQSRRSPPTSPCTSVSSKTLQESCGITSSSKSSHSDGP